MRVVSRYADTQASRQFEKEFTRLWPKHVRLKKDGELPVDLMHQITPNSVTVVDLQLNAPREKAVYVASGDQVFDIITFWNLRATGVKTAFYDRSSAGRLEKFLSRFQGFDNELETSVGAAAVRLFAKDKASLDETPFAGSNFTPSEHFLTSEAFPRPRFGTRSRSILASMDDGNPPSIDFALPEKPSLEGVGFHQQHVILEITSHRNVISQSDYVFPPPPVAALNSFYGRRMWYHQEAVRAMPEGLAFFVRATSENFQIRGIETFDVIQRLFELAGLNVHRSKPGLIARQLVQQMGGDLQDCRVFKITGVRSLIETYQPTEAFVRSEAIQIIKELDFGSHASLYIEKRTHPSLTPEDVFSFLLQKEVFRAGLELECPNCQLRFWKHIDDLYN